MMMVVVLGRLGLMKCREGKRQEEGHVVMLIRGPMSLVIMTPNHY